MSAPVDVANDYLDAARASEDTSADTCGGEVPLHPDVAGSSAQNLANVSISGGRATVTGTLRQLNGSEDEIRITLGRSDGDWCVGGVEL